MTVSHGKPYAGNLHVRFDEGADVPDEGRLALLHSPNELKLMAKNLKKLLSYGSSQLHSTRFPLKCAR